MSTVDDSTAPPRPPSDVEDVLASAASPASTGKAVARHRRRVDVRRDGDPPRRLHRAGLHGLWGINGRTLRARDRRRARRLARRQPHARPARRPHRPPRIFQYSILWYAVFTALTALAWGPWSVMTLPLPGRPRARRDARRRSVDALRVPAAAAARTLPRLPRLLVAGRAPARDRAFVHLPRPDVRPLRRLRLALPLPRRVVPGLPRVPRAPRPCRRARTSSRGKGRTKEAAEVLGEITGRPVRPSELDAAPEPRVVAARARLGAAPRPRRS